jgi:hypothetical protein
MGVLLGLAGFVVVLVAGGFGYDWRQRRRHAPFHDIAAATEQARLRDDRERLAQEGGQLGGRRR